MTAPRVLSVKQAGRVPAGAVYIGRAIRWGDPFWGNPFVIGRDGTRDEVIEQFERWLRETTEGQARLRRIGELAGKDLVCHCAPRRCHGDVLLRYANSAEAEP